jgi:hypothetical protein
LGAVEDIKGLGMQSRICASAIIAGVVSLAGAAAPSSAVAQTSPTQFDQSTDVAAPLPPVRTDRSWRILRDRWTATDEKAYEDFIRAIGESNCRTTDQCLKHAANVYRGSNPRGVNYFADCADLPYTLRGYFAWMNGLPFAFASAVAPNGYTRDVRYVASGNRIIEKAVVINWPGQQPMDGPDVLRRVSNYVSTAMYRYHPEEKRGLPADHYSSSVDPRSIRPGTNIYDPNGHVAVVYRVDPDGRIHYIDAHPDNSITRGVYGRKFVRSRPTMGAGFKNWRPVQLVGATRAPDGSLVGGRYTYTQNSDLEDFSVDQYFGNGTQNNRQWQGASFAFEGQRLDYYDWVRTAVAGRNLVYDPLTETRNMMRGLCDDITYRVYAVEEAVSGGINRKPQPSRLPQNIYGTSGEWETYSTPSRDARLKTSFVELRDEIARFVELVENGSERVKYTGTDVRADLLSVYRQEVAACSITYTDSAGAPVELGFDDVQNRLFDLSFDPYHCPERRWGATDPAELASCKDGNTKRAWYEAEQRLRNQTERTYDVRMDFSLAQLRSGVNGSGKSSPPDIDVVGLLSSPAPQIRADIEGTVAQ